MILIFNVFLQMLILILFFENSSQIDIFITLGHRATLKSKQTDDGFTHDWLVYVKGDEGNAIEHFIDRVVFNLHTSFPKPKRGRYY